MSSVNEVKYRNQCKHYIIINKDDLYYHVAITRIYFK